MPYKQIDKTKILVHESGRVREEMRNLPDDSDRFLYSRNKDGEIKNEWPKLIIEQDSEGREDIRLLPELVLKYHGDLPPSLRCSAKDFEAADGNKLNCSIENVKYIGAGFSGQKSPYKEPPAPAEPNDSDSEPAEGEDVEDGKAKVAAAPPADEPPSDLAKGSGALNVKQAAAVIRKYDFAELSDSGFLDKDEDRVTVLQAWESAKKAWQEEN